jgi:head-tail adaptor
MTTAGKRTRRVALQKGTPTSDDYGGETIVWATHTDAFAEVLFGTGQERREAAQEAGSQAATFIVPWTPKLAQVVLRDRIEGLGSTWDITSIAPVGLNKEIHFTATRNV